MSNCCPNCNTYQKFSGTDFCCRTCRDYPGNHGQGCKRVPCYASSTPSASPACCPSCKTYQKYPGFDFCCQTCRRIPGTHGQGCLRVACSTSTAPPASSTCCPNCQTYQKYPGFDFCCQTCRRVPGTHGPGCKMLSCSTASVSSPSSQTKLYCSNLRTGQPLYDEATTICFYETSNPYYEFTNFYQAPITIGFETYPTTEHYFQAQKFLPSHAYIANQIRNATSPRDALNIARSNQQYLRPDWHNGYKDAVMLDALRAKFTQHANLKDLLINTGNKILVEHTTNDNYWEDNGDGTGQNQLGKLLMQVRDQLAQGTAQQGGNEKNYYELYRKYKKKYLDMKNQR